MQKVLVLLDHLDPRRVRGHTPRNSERVCGEHSPLGHDFGWNWTILHRLAASDF